MDKSRGRVTAVAWPAPVLLSTLLEVPEDRIVGADLLPVGRFTVVSDLPPGGAGQLQSEIERALGKAWGVRLHKEKRKVNGYVLRTPHGTSPGLRPPSARTLVVTGAQGIEAKRQTISWLAKTLENQLHRPVIDETHLTGNYDFQLRWQTPDPAGILAAVGRLGLRLEPMQSDMEVVVVEKSR